MNSKKKDYHLQAKRKAYQEVNSPSGSAVEVETSKIVQSQPEDSAKKAEEVKVATKGQAAKVSDVEADTTEPAAIGTPAS